jgi:general secretion pathway protein H
VWRAADITTYAGRRRPKRARGFTLVELLAVLTIVALGTALAALALRDSDSTALAREADRLAALLESARAQSRAAGVPVRWRPVAGGFAFDGLPAIAPKLPERWLDARTVVASDAPLLLGPEPVIGAQAVVLQRAGSPSRLWVGTDGLRPFSVEQVQ